MSMEPFSPKQVLSSANRDIPSFVIEAINVLLCEAKCEQSVDEVGPLIITEAQIVESLESGALRAGVDLDELAWQDFVYVFAKYWDINVVFSRLEVTTAGFFWQRKTEIESEVIFEFSPKGVAYDS